MLKRHLLGLAVVVSTGAVAGMLAASGVSTAGETDPHQLVSDDPTGQMRTFDVNGALDVDNPFFKDLGTNGRTCFSCHRPAQGWTITPESVQGRFAESRGLDPIFRTNDGSNCEGADVSTVGKRQAARVVMVRGRLVNPVVGGGTGISTEPAVIDAHRVFINENPGIGRSQRGDIALFFKQSVRSIQRGRGT